MQAALKDKNDIKIFILYLMRNVGYPLEFENLNDIVIQDGVVGYFDFVECFGELLDTGNVREIKGENGDLYEITEQGKHVSDSLEGNLLGLIRDKSLKSALRLLSFKKRGSDIKCTSEPRDDGRYTLTSSIIEQHEEIMHIELIADNLIELEKMKYNFRDNPEICYKGILALMSGEVNYLLQ